ncbi:MAG: alpha/beta hydrolase, partial [Coriobacteriia bacterium]|nr:alpha/beta hydrolase [Coriobacteriia bacterium]
CGFPFTNGAYAALTGLIRQMGSRQSLDGIPKDLKLLFVAGQDDPVGYFGRGVQAAAKAYQKAGLRKIDVWIRPGLRHEVFNEPGWPELADETVSWLEEALDL